MGVHPVTAILGLNAFHADAAAALLIDGRLVAAAEEERFTRVKHCAGFPELAARWCLEDAGLAPGDIDHIAISRDPRANLGRKFRWLVRHGTPAYYLKARLKNAAKIVGVRDTLAHALGAGPKELRAELHNVEHHQAHVASAFLVSPFEDAAVLSIDGFGDFASTMLAVGRSNRFEVLDRVLFPHSLGCYYTAVTQWLGFPKHGDEGKVMGLAPYGDPDPHRARMREVLHSNGSLFELGLDYFTHHREGIETTWNEQTPRIGRIYSDRMDEAFGPSREPRTELTRRHEDVAASLQAILEETYLRLLHELWERTRVPNVCLAGGVALNAVANGRIREETPFDGVYVQPAAGDSGTAVGSAFQVWNEHLGRDRGYVMDHAYTGPEYSDADCAAAIERAGLRSELLDDDALFPRVAGRIEAGDVVGWFQGRMEFGPRALGNRSIVVDPRRADMKDILNSRVKHREPFRPFAPSILAEETGQWFEQDYPSPFMVLVYRTRPERREQIPAVNHVDDTGRLQTVDRRANPRYHRLIREFAGLTGVPILLNTSFNEDEPVVMTPEHAVDTFTRTRMDLLVLGNRVVSRAA
jgi:carbamoyltransferase